MYPIPGDLPLTPCNQQTGTSSIGMMMRIQMPFHQNDHYHHLHHFDHLELIADHHHQTLLINPHDHPHQHQPPQPEAKVMNVELERSFFKTGKPRLRWTPELHARFIHAASKLGGLSKATPRATLNLMNVEGVTISQLKSHLQKSRRREQQKKLKEKAAITHGNQKNAATQLSKSAELSSYVPSANYLNHVGQTGGHKGADKEDKTPPQKETSFTEFQTRKPWIWNKADDMKRATFASKFWKLSAGGSSSSEYVNNQRFGTFEEKWETKAEILESKVLTLHKVVGPCSWLVSDDHYPQAGGATVQQHQAGFVVRNNSVVSPIIYPTTNPPPLTTAVTNGIDLGAFHLSLDKLDRPHFSADELFVPFEQKPKLTSLAPAP